jgi:hypothetical protein
MHCALTYGLSLLKLVPRQQGAPTRPQLLQVPPLPPFSRKEIQTDPTMSRRDQAPVRRFRHSR